MCTVRGRRGWRRSVCRSQDLEFPEKLPTLDPAHPRDRACLRPSRPPPEAEVGALPGTRGDGPDPARGSSLSPTRGPGAAGPPVQDSALGPSLSSPLAPLKGRRERPRYLVASAAPPGRPFTCLGLASHHRGLRRERGGERKKESQHTQTLRRGKGGASPPTGSERRAGGEEKGPPAAVRSGGGRATRP